MDGIIKSYSNSPSVTGIEYAIVPNSIYSNSSDSQRYYKYAAAGIYSVYSSSKSYLRSDRGYSQSQINGIMYWCADTTTSHADITAHLMVLPSQRIN